MTAWLRRWRWASSAAPSPTSRCTGSRRNCRGPTRPTASAIWKDFGGRAYARRSSCRVCVALPAQMDDDVEPRDLVARKRLGYPGEGQAVGDVDKHILAFVLECCTLRVIRHEDLLDAISLNPAQPAGYSKLVKSVG